MARPFVLTGDDFKFTAKANLLIKAEEGDEFIVEAPFIIRELNREGRYVYYLFGAANEYSSANYNIWVAEVDSLSAGRARNRRTLLKTGYAALGGWTAPGHMAAEATEVEGIYKTILHVMKAGAGVAIDDIWDERDNPQNEHRVPIILTLAFRTRDGRPCPPYFMEQRYPQGFILGASRGSAGSFVLPRPLVDVRAALTGDKWEAAFESTARLHTGGYSGTLPPGRRPVDAMI